MEAGFFSFRRQIAIANPVAAPIPRLYVRLPTDVVERIEAKAKGEGRPFNRILVNELALFPHLDGQARLGELSETWSPSWRGTGRASP